MGDMPSCKFNTSNHMGDADDATGFQNVLLLYLYRVGEEMVL
jgi:hypothetical protein